MRVGANRLGPQYIGGPSPLYVAERLFGEWVDAVSVASDTAGWGQRTTVFSGPCDGTAPAAVRRRLESLTPPVPRGVIADWQLIATELVTNALNASSDWLDVELNNFEGEFELHVRDEADGFRNWAARGPATSAGAVCSSWSRWLRLGGVRLEAGHGKTVWARLQTS